MKSTWRTADRKEWNHNHWALELLNAHPQDLDKEVPVHSKDEKIPFMPQWSLQRWVLFYSALPLIFHQTYMTMTGRTLGPFATFNLYFLAFNATVIYQVHVLRRLGHKYGFLDGDKHERDGVPDVGIAKSPQARSRRTRDLVRRSRPPQPSSHHTRIHACPP